MKTFPRILPILICFFLLTVGMSFVFYRGQVSAQSSLDASLERYITTEGIIIDLRATDEGEIWLRGMDCEGTLLGQIVLYSGNLNSSEAISYHIVGFVDDEIYLAEARRSLRSVIPIVQRVLVANLATNSLSEVGIVPEHNTSDPKRTLISFGVTNNLTHFAEIASTPDNGSIIHIKGMDIRSGQATSTRAIRADFDVIWLNVAANGIITAISASSDVYCYQESTWSLLYTSKGSEALIEASVGADGSIYLFMLNDRSVVYRFRPGNVESLQELFLGGMDDALGLVCASDGTYIAEISIADPGQYRAAYVATVGGETSLIGAVKLPFDLLWKNMQLGRWAVSFIILLALLAAALFIRLRTHVSIIAKQILAAVPVVIVGLLLFMYFSRSLMTDTLYADRYLVLGEQATTATSLIDADRFARIDWDNPEDDAYYQEIKNILEGLSGYSEVSWWQSPTEIVPYWDSTIEIGENGSMHNSSLVDYRAYYVSGSTAYTAVYDGAPANLEASYRESMLSDMDVLSLLNENKLPVHASVFDARDEEYWLSFYAPLWSRGNLVGYIEASEPSLNIEARVDTLNNLALGVIALLMFVPLVLIVFVLVFTLRRLGRLKAGAEAVAAGDYSVYVKVDSRDEAGDIAKAFNTMAASVKESVEDITKTSEGYSRFVPAELIAALGKPSIREVTPGAHVDVEASNLFISTPSFAEYSDEDLFRMLNYYYETVIPPIVDSGGIISHFSSANLSVIYEGGIVSALDSAIATYATLDGLNRLLVEQGNPPIVCHALLSHSKTLLGVAGTNRRLDIITVSPLGNRTEKIAELGRVCGCRLLVAQSAFEALGTAVTHYPYRWAGYIRSDRGQPRVYDFYFCEAPALRRGKEQSKDIFEYGVGLYYEGRYQEASTYFVQVVKVAPDDGLAREYLHRCHALEKAGQMPTELVAL
jgi:HAMP domain-containing protein